MKKTGIISLIAIFISLAIVGCGSNSKQDPLQSTAGPYMFINASTTDVNSSSTGYTLFIQLLKDGVGEAEAEVKLAPYDARFGIVSPATVTTDTDGWATFSYTSPSNVEALAGQSAMFYPIYDDGKGNVINGSILVNFKAPTPTPATCSGTTSTCSGTP
jgi:hypothetical protein